MKRFLSLVAASALAAGALVTISANTAAAAGVPCQRSYTNGVDVGIPDDSSTISSAIDVPEDGLVVSDIDVTFNINHTFDSDLEVWLESYTDADGFRDSSRLVYRDGGSADNFLNTVLDDEAADPVSWGSAPFTGRYRPNRPLSAYDGETGGYYYLAIYDDAAGDSGTLTSWGVTIRYQSCDFDGDGVEDHADKCLDITAHTATGCPLTSRSLSAKYTHGKFKGALFSPVHGCKAGRAVTIWKKRGGPDLKVGTATTASDGTYKLRRARHSGKYYATSPRAAVTDVAECPASTSPTFKIS